MQPEKITERIEITIKSDEDIKKAARYLQEIKQGNEMYRPAGLEIKRK